MAEVSTSRPHCVSRTSSTRCDWREKSGVDCAFGKVAADAYRRLCDQGFGRDNESRIIDTLRKA
jgi:hypothetical protein